MDARRSRDDLRCGDLARTLAKPVRLSELENEHRNLPATLPARRNLPASARGVRGNRCACFRWNDRLVAVVEDPPIIFEFMARISWARLPSLEHSCDHFNMQVEHHTCSRCLLVALAWWGPCCLKLTCRLRTCNHVSEDSPCCFVARFEACFQRDETWLERDSYLRRTIKGPATQELRTGHVQELIAVWIST